MKQAQSTKAAAHSSRRVAGCPGRREWLSDLANLSSSDRVRIGRLADLLLRADRPRAETARSMLAAPPFPTTAEEARTRADQIISFLEQRPRRTTENRKGVNR